MSQHARDIDGFSAVYRRHVDLVVAGDLKGVMADMAPGSVPKVFEGVDTPAGGVLSAEVVSVSVDGERAVGEAVYQVEGREIGLRSGWGHDGDVWLADHLENFTPGEAR